MTAETHTVEPNETTQMARQNTLLSPRFYTTDFDAMDRIDISPVRKEWDDLIAEFNSDHNRKHFTRTPEFETAVAEMPEDLREEFIDFLVSSCTAEYSGCVLYADIKKNVKNQDIGQLMGYMARDESRHAGFINQSLKDFDLGVDLNFLRQKKAYTFFKPKFIFYATYLSEKIGYARYITIFRNFERHPDRRFHPIFKWFEEWCNDEFRHGEAFALLMRANPHLLKGHNKLWIRFFLLAVFATMYVRDHKRPAMYNAFGMDPGDFGWRVFDITTAITRQVFPVELDIENPKFRARFNRLVEVSRGREEAKARGGLMGTLKYLGLGAVGAATFVQLYCMPTKTNDLPDTVRLAPAW